MINKLEHAKQVIKMGSHLTGAVVFIIIASLIAYDLCVEDIIDPPILHSVPKD